MVISLFQTSEYRKLMEDHILQTIEYLFNKNQNFSLACEIEHVTFMPELPSNIKKSFQNTVLFIISEYSLESAKIDENNFSFEAGFGDNNFASTVYIPLLAIKQVFVGENPILLNLTKPFLSIKKTTKEENIKQSSSMEALLNNPENKKLLKKNK